MLIVINNQYTLLHPLLSLHPLIPFIPVFPAFLSRCRLPRIILSVRALISDTNELISLKRGRLTQTERMRPHQSRAAQNLFADFSRGSRLRALLAVHRWYQSAARSARS